MIDIILNGSPKKLEGECDLTALLKRSGFTSPYIAVAVNERVVPRAKHSETRISNGDRVDIIEPVGGG